jgi:hypothetical protein
MEAKQNPDGSTTITLQAGEILKAPDQGIPYELSKKGYVYLACSNNCGKLIAVPESYQAVICFECKPEALIPEGYFANNIAGSVSELAAQKIIEHCKYDLAKGNPYSFCSTLNDIVKYLEHYKSCVTDMVSYGGKELKT